jgi:hypothetical protein
MLLPDKLTSNLALQEKAKDFRTVEAVVKENLRAENGEAKAVDNGVLKVANGDMVTETANLLAATGEQAEVSANMKAVSADQKAANAARKVANADLQVVSEEQIINDLQAIQATSLGETNDKNMKGKRLKASFFYTPKSKIYKSTLYMFFSDLSCIVP